MGVVKLVQINIYLEIAIETENQEKKHDVHKNKADEIGLNSN